MVSVLKHMPLGERLLRAGVVTPQQVQHALFIQKTSRARLGEILIGQGALNHLLLYQALAAQWNRPFINLQEHPCDPALLQPEDAPEYIAAQAVPWRKEGDVLLLAVADAAQFDASKIPALLQQPYRLVLATPQDILDQIASLSRNYLSDEAVNRLWRFEPQRSAKRFFMRRSKAVPWMAAFSIALLAYTGLETMVLLLLGVINLIYLLALMFKFHIFCAGLLYGKRHHRPPAVSDDALPIYTLLVPLFQEPENTVAHLLHSLRALDYPREKLDIKLIVEEDDAQTLRHLLAAKPERYFHIVKVPYSLPRTKPKACNYALLFARGQLATIYDAEDAPHPQQLRIAAAMFAESGNRLGCVQARLNYYNRNDNLLTRLFSLEYAMWFDAMLYGLEHLGMPMPLGGTSNHFRTHVLKAIHGWDPFNVTEDADLGLRLAEAGFHTRILNSETLEEAPNNLKNWIRQRTRWVKGYIQTFVVHLRHPRRAIRVLGLKGVLGFVLFVGSASFAFVITPLILIVSLIAYWQEMLLPMWLHYLLLLNLLGGLGGHLLIALIVLLRRRWWGCIHAALIFPLYWCLHTIASIRAVIQLVGGKAHLWEKTIHGVFKRKDLTAGQKLVSSAPL